ATCSTRNNCPLFGARNLAAPPSSLIQLPASLRLKHRHEVERRYVRFVLPTLCIRKSAGRALFSKLIEHGLRIRIEPVVDDRARDIRGQAVADRPKNSLKDGRLFRLHDVSLPDARRSRNPISLTLPPRRALLVSGCTCFRIFRGGSISPD